MAESFFSIYRLLETVAFMLLIFYMPGLKFDGSFTSYMISSPVELSGPFALNTLLNKAEHLYSGLLKGPASLANVGGYIYTGVHGGEVVRLGDNLIVPIAKFGKHCEGQWEEAKCGRPFGLAWDENGTLFVADAYYGIWSLDVASCRSRARDSGSCRTKSLVPSGLVIEDKVPNIFNSMALSSEGDIYWTDSSTDVDIQNGVYAMFMDGSGRLLKYSPEKNQSEVLVKELRFPAGLLLSPDEDFIVVAEMISSRLLRHFISGPRKGETEVFTDQLPGFPDKLRAAGDYILVPLVHARDLAQPVMFQYLAPYPFVRKILVRTVTFIETALKLVHNLAPVHAIEEVIHKLGHFESVSMFSPKRVTVLVVDWSGNVVDSWHNLDGSLEAVSDVLVCSGYLYFGSPYNNYIGRVKMPKNDFNLDNNLLDAVQDKGEDIHDQ